MNKFYERTEPMYDQGKGMTPGLCQEKRPSLIKQSMERIEKAAVELDTLVAGVGTTFSSVIYHQPCVAACGRDADKTLPGSDLGQALSAIAERLERSNEILRDILSQSDV